MSTDIELTVNGIPQRMRVGDDDLLLEVLRRIGHTSVREGCGVGACGACTVLADGRSVSSCLA
ncbi:MAG: aerobic carbon-monoxide dehydrogenase small subunit, partial [Pseudonocardiales bacterium]|nr:aerobic carbon-monoxide dehydrogenase small subunit [Pseudonocardiales bacterium]